MTSSSNHSDILAVVHGFVFSPRLAIPKFISARTHSLAILMLATLSLTAEQTVIMLTLWMLDRKLGQTVLSNVIGAGVSTAAALGEDALYLRRSVAECGAWA